MISTWMRKSFFYQHMLVMTATLSLLASVFNSLQWAVMARFQRNCQAVTHLIPRWCLAKKVLKII